MVTQIGRRTGLDLGAAREKLRVAAALADLNHIAAAMARGQLSYSKVRALTRVATPATEARLLAVALGATAAHVERLVRAWRRADRDAQADAEQVRLASRALSMQVDEDGMIVMRGRLTPEVGAVLLRAVEAALEQVPATAEGGESTIAQRRAVAAMARGQLSYSKVRALTRVATPATEARLLAVALGATAAHVERLVRAWRRADRDAQADAEQVRLASRALSMQVDEDGMIVMRGRLTPEVGAVLLRAVEAALEQVPATAEGGESTIAQRRAVALGLVAESALAGGLDPGNPAGWSQETPMGSSGSCARTASRCRRCRRGQAGKGLRWRRPTRGWRQPASASAPTPPPPSGTGSRST